MSKESIGKEDVCGGGTRAYNSDGLRVHSLRPSQKKKEKKKKKKMRKREKERNMK